jgi:hypothetical protein
MQETVKVFEMVCSNCSNSYFIEEYPGSFYVLCHLCEHQQHPNPDYKNIIDDLEILKICDLRHEGVLNTPDKVLANKYSQQEIYAKMEELEHRGLIEYGVSLRTAWTSDSGRKLVYK